jgi:hypothetical protein
MTFAKFETELLQKKKKKVPFVLVGKAILILELTKG